MKTIQYTNIRRILDEIHRHPLMLDVTLEQVVSYVITFIDLFGFPKTYSNKEVTLEIEDYRCKLPCDCIEVTSVKECKYNIYLKSMTSVFKMDENKTNSFKIQGNILFTSFRNGIIEVNYNSIPIDDDGFPLLIDNSVFLKTLEAYIKKEVFTILFDLNKVNNQVLQNAQQQYSWLAGQLRAEMNTPDINEMESIKSMWCSLIQKDNHFYNGFRDLGENYNIKF